MNRRHFLHFLRHLTAPGFTVYCFLCSATFNTEVELAAHLSSAHPGGR